MALAHTRYSQGDSGMIQVTKHGQLERRCRAAKSFQLDGMNRFGHIARCYLGPPAQLTLDDTGQGLGMRVIVIERRHQL